MTIKQLGGVFGRNPTFNDVTIEGELTFDGDIDVNSDLKVDGNLDVTGTGDFGGKVKVTEAGNGEIEIERTGGALINLQAQSARGVIGTNSNHELQLKSNSTGRLKIKTNGDVEVMSGNLVIGTSGKGIDFSATSGTGTSELFDDYEEGTFTATLEGSTNPATKVTTTAIYTKIGRVVQFEISFEGVDTTGYSGNLSVSGLPFTSINRTPQSILTYNSANWTGTPVPLVAPNNTIIQVFSIDSGGVWSFATHDAGASRYINIAGSYTTA
jgi:cytoskeletal protein CcmA (bactofilin family)